MWFKKFMNLGCGPDHAVDMVECGRNVGMVDHAAEHKWRQTNNDLKQMAANEH